MVSAKNVTLATVAATAALATTASAHGNLVLPKPTFKGYGGGFSAIVPSSVLTEPEGMHFNWGADGNAAAFDTAFKPTGQSLKDFILKNQDTTQASGTILSKECGYSDPKGTPQPLPDAITWTDGKFIHPGPCEAWCDDELVVPFTANCWKTFADGTVPYSKAKCAGKQQLTFYWLAVHSPPWQVYINCVPLSGASTGGSGNNSTTTTPKPTATAKTKTPKPTTVAPVASDATPAPASTTKAPASGTKAPGSKCKRKA